MLQDSDSVSTLIAPAEDQKIADSDKQYPFSMAPAVYGHAPH